MFDVGGQRSERKNGYIVSRMLPTLYFVSLLVNTIRFYSKKTVKTE